MRYYRVVVLPLTLSTSKIIALKLYYVSRRWGRSCPVAITICLIAFSSSCANKPNPISKLCYIKHTDSATRWIPNPNK